MYAAPFEAFDSQRGTLDKLPGTPRTCNKVDRMDTPEQAELRAALARAIETQGMRPVARQVGLSPMGARNVALGKNLHEATWTKIREWYGREVVQGKQVQLQAAPVLLELLLRHVAPALRESVRRVLVEDVGRVYAQAAMPAPSWLTTLPDALRAYEEETDRRRAPFAVVELTRGDRLVLTEQPFPGDPRAVVEEMAAGRGVWNGDTYYPPHRVHRVTYAPGEGST